MALSFYYVKICAKIRRNLRAKKRMLPAGNSNIVKPLIKLSSGSSSTMELSSTLPDFANSFRPRAHSLEGISRAKIKSVKQTIGKHHALKFTAGQNFLKKSRQKYSWNQINHNFFSWNCLFDTFSQFKNWFLVIFEMAKNGIVSKKKSWNWFIWFHEFFLAWTF